jgi:hypothetical protein
VTTPFLRLPTYISRMRRSSFGAPFCSERSDPIDPQQSRAVPTQAQMARNAHSLHGASQGHSVQATDSMRK